MPGYTIEKLLGRGGMGAVYKGVQQNLDRTVAIKVLPPGVEKEDPSFAERFKNEAKLMAKLLHPAVVAVFDFGTTSGGQLYIAMEYVDGSDVSQMIRSQGKLPPEHALAITAHVCDALAAAHELGIVHRDIKPANVLLNMKGQVKVADFGLAKVEEPGQHGLTKTGYAMGTPDFVAPEVLMLGSSIDGRADLYAVGVMLYQMLTGEVPRGAFKPASVRMPGLDRRYDPIIMKAMQSDREERYQSSAELRRDLDVILTVPLVKQEDPASAAIPVSQVAQMPAQRSAAQKPIGKPPQPRSADAPVRQPASIKAGEGTRAPAKSKAPLFIGLGIAAAAAIGAFVMFSGGKKPTVVQPVTAAKLEATKPASNPNTSLPTTSKPATTPAATTPVSSTYPQPSKWNDTTAALRSKYVADGLLAADGEWLKATKGTTLTLGGGVQLHNPIVRVLFSNRVDIRLRRTLSKESDTCYVGSIGPNSSVISFNAEVLNAANLENQTPKRSLTSKTSSNRLEGEHEAVFVAQGDTLTLWLDGALMATTQDPTLSSGSIALTLKDDPGGDCRIKKVEYGELPDLASAVAMPKITPAPLTAPINLLALVEVKRDAVKGQWELKQEGLAAKSGKEQWLSLHHTPPEEYDFEIEFTLNSGKEVSQVLPLPGAPIVWKMGFGNTTAPTQYFGFGPFFNRINLNGSASTGSKRTEGVSQQPRFKLNQRYRSLVQVRKGSLRALLDGVEVAQWTGDLTRFTGETGFALPDPTHLGLSSYESDIVFHKVELRPASTLSAKPAVASTSPAPSAISNSKSPISNPPAFPPGQWVKMFTKFEDLPEDLRKPDSGVKFEDGWIRLGGGPRRNIFLPQQLQRNYAVRAKFVRIGASFEDRGQIACRLSSDKLAFYQAFASSIKLIIQYTKDGKYPELASVPIQSIPVGSEYTLELFVVGNHLGSRLNGTSLSTVTDATLSTGRGLIEGREDIRDIEVINLDGLPEAEALRILGVDEKGNDTRAAALAAEKLAMEQKQVAQAAASIPELVTLDEQFKQLTAERVTAPFAVEVAKLHSGYLGGLDRKRAEEKAAGHLDSVLALEAEKTLIVASSGTRSQGADGLRLPMEFITR